MSLGVEVLATKAAAETAKVVIAQVNDRMPRVLGDSFIHVSRFHKLVEVSESLPELEKSPFSDVERMIGKYIADLIEDGSTLQLGIGGIPDAVLAALSGPARPGHPHRDGLRRRHGGDRKRDHHRVEEDLPPGQGRDHLRPRQRPAVRIHRQQPRSSRPIRPTTPIDPFIVARNDNMVAINSAIEVDITGQVCSDSIGTSSTAGSAARSISSAAPPAPRGASRSSPFPRRRRTVR